MQAKQHVIEPSLFRSPGEKIYPAPKNLYLFGKLPFILQEEDEATKKKILGYIFSKKLVLEKGKVATYEFTKPIQVLLNASKGFKNLGTKKRSNLTSCAVWLP